MSKEFYIYFWTLRNFLKIVQNLFVTIKIGF